MHCISIQLLGKMTSYNYDVNMATICPYIHHHHHLSRSCHCWQMASTTCAMHFDPGPFSSIDCQRLPRCHLSISFWVLPLSRFPSLGVHSDVIFAHLVFFILATCPAHCPFMHFTFSIISITPVFDLIISYINPVI